MDINYATRFSSLLLNQVVVKGTVRSKKKKIRVGADQTFQLAIREISINRCQS
jgi:hypothetical protein